MYKLYIKENLTSKQLLDYALFDYANIKDYELYYNKYGKPYLKDSNIYFNISHTRNLVICAISDKEIGVDIEKLVYNELVSKRILNQKEYSILLNSKCKEEIFTIMWTSKESYVKMLGIGLEYGLKNVDTTILNSKIDIKKYNDYIIAISKEE